MTLPVQGWRGGSWFLQFIHARVNKFSICEFGLYLNFKHNYKNYNCHNYKSFNYNIFTFSFAPVEFDLFSCFCHKVLFA